MSNLSVNMSNGMKVYFGNFDPKLKNMTVFRANGAIR